MSTENSARLIAQELIEDPRIVQAKQLILAAVSDHQKKLTGIRPPHPELKLSYEEMLNTLSQYRGGKLWYPYLGSGFGKGALVELADGSVKYDLISGIGTHYWGHSHPEIIEAAVEAAFSNTIMQGHLQQNADTLELTRLLVKAVRLDHCFLTTSGAMANENALKIAFQRNAPANRILAFERCFQGRTLALTQITDKAAYREGLPSTMHVDYLPFFDPSSPQESSEKAVWMLKNYLARYPKQHAVMCFELVQGEGGIYPGSKEFFHRLMTILKEQQIAILVDEVQTFGRTPALMAFHYYELESFVDIATIGKLSQVCATLFNDDYKPRTGLLSQTFTSSSSAIKVAIVILESLLTDGYFGPDGKIMQLHNHFAGHLENLTHKYPTLVNGPFGIGSMLAMTPYNGDHQRVTQFVHRLFDAGVISFTAGSDPTRVRFLIPVGAITFKDIDHAMTVIEETLVNSSRE